MGLRFGLAAIVLLCAFSGLLSAEIVRWNTGELIPGTEGIAGPNADLVGKNLEFAGLSVFDFTNADLSDAIVAGARFGSSNLIAEQLYSTASYKDRNLPGVQFGPSIEGWNLQGQDLTGASFFWTQVTDADFTDAIIQGVGFNQGSGNSPEDALTREQLYSTKSYQSKDLQRVRFPGVNLDGWDFIGQDLRGAYLSDASLVDAKFDDAKIAGVHFGAATEHGLTAEAVYATDSYQAKDLRGLSAEASNFSGWELGDMDLSRGSFWFTDLSTANLSNSNLTFAVFQEANLEKADLSNANLTGANLIDANLAGANLAGAVLVNVHFEGADLLPADLRGADIRNAHLGDTWPHSAKMNEATIYNQGTIFPSYFDPIAAGLTYVESAVGDFLPDGILDERDYELLTQDFNGLFRPTDDSHVFRPFNEVFDLNGNQVPDKEDEWLWIHEVRKAIPGDADLDGDVDFEDFLRLAEGFGNAGDWTNGDFDLDGHVAFGDFTQLADSFGMLERSVTSVPEPDFLWLPIVILVTLRLQFVRQRTA